MRRGNHIHHGRELIGIDVSESSSIRGGEIEFVGCRAGGGNVHDLVSGEQGLFNSPPFPGPEKVSAEKSSSIEVVMDHHYYLVPLPLPPPTRPGTLIPARPEGLHANQARATPTWGVPLYCWRRSQHARSESGAVSAGADSWKCQGTHSNEMARDTVIIEKRWR